VQNLLGSGAVVFWGFLVRCGRVKVVSSSIGSVWRVTAELLVPPHKGEGSWPTRSLIGLGRPLRKFIGVRCGSFLAFLGPCGRVNVVSSSLGSVWKLVSNYESQSIRGKVPGLPIV